MLNIQICRMGIELITYTRLKRGTPVPLRQLASIYQFNYNFYLYQLYFFQKTASTTQKDIRISKQARRRTRICKESVISCRIQSLQENI